MYIFGYTSLLIFSFLEVFANKKFFLFPFFLVLMIFSGIRYNVGVDYSAYVNIFNDVLSIADRPLIETGFKYLILFSKSLGMSVFTFLFVVSNMALLLYYLVLNKLEYKIFSLFIFFNTELVTVIFSGVRQGLVMGLFVFSIQFIYKRELGKVIFLSMVAYSLHVTGILILICYIFPPKYVIKKNVLIIMVLVVMFFLYINVSDYFVSIFPSYIKSKFVDYSMGFDEVINFQRVIQRLFLLLPFIIFYELIISESDELKHIFYLYFIGFVIYILFSSNLAFATKINQFFRVLEVIIYPMLIALLYKTNKIILFILLVCWSTLILLLFINKEGNYPYQTIFM